MVDNMDNMINNIVWDERYDIGVKKIDSAHRRLFSIVRKLYEIVDNKQNVQHFCYEAVKYLNNYVMTHFVEEEAYMRSIKYKGYEEHKFRHDKMATDIIPEIEKELEETSYSEEAVNHFIGVCLGWLTGHTMLEDREITGKIDRKKDTDINTSVNNLVMAKGKATDEEMEIIIDNLDKAVSLVIKELFNLEIKTANRHYNGEYFGKSVYYRVTYKNKKGKRIKILMVIEEKLILKTVGKIIDVKFDIIDKSILSAATQISNHIIDSVGKYLRLKNSKNEQYVIERSTLLDAEYFKDKFVASYFDFRILFNTEEGSFAFCAKQI